MLPWDQLDASPHPNCILIGSVQPFWPTSLTAESPLPLKWGYHSPIKIAHHRGPV